MILSCLKVKFLKVKQETLDKFYASVQERAKGIDNAEGKQKIIIELYEQFFKNALPKEENAPIRAKNAPQNKKSEI